MDSNHDGLIQQSEFKTMDRLFIKEFSRFDQNKDLTLYNSELDLLLVSARWFRSILTT
jgi:hypothetical protein